MKTLALVLALLLTGTCVAFQADWEPLPSPTPDLIGEPAFNPLIDDEVAEDDDTVKKTALRAYMIENQITGRWLRRTVPFQINAWVLDYGSASIYVNKQEAHQVWISLGFPRRNAEIKTFMLVPIENE